MLRRTGMAIVLAAILAFGTVCPALAEPENRDMLIIDGQGEAPLDLPEIPEADGIAIDWQEDTLKQFDVETPTVAAVANRDPIHSTLDVSNLPVIETDVSSPSAGCVMLGLRGRYLIDVPRALARINEIRLEACREGVDNPDNPGTPLTMNDYVPIRWSPDLEYIARIRAAEASVSRGHTRLTDKSIWGLLSPSGIQSWGEVIAWNGSSDAVTGINQWYGEKTDWVNKTPGAVTGHYTQMIEPSHTYVGLGMFCSEDVYYFNTTVGEFFTDYGFGPSPVGSDETPMAFTGDCIQKLEVKADSIAGGSLLGTQSGIAGDTSELALAASVRGCRLLVPGNVAWSSSAPGIASVDGSGKVTALSCGVAAITADAPGVLSASANFTVNHVEEAMPAVAATCTDSGLSAGVKCSVCGVVLQPQQIVPALGHAYGEWVITRQPTVFQTGTRQRSCANCGVQETGTVPTLTPVLKVSKTSVTLSKTQSRSVNVTVANGDAFTAGSSNGEIAKVSAGSGKLTLTAGKVAGTAVITVRTTSGLETDILVKVSKAKTTKISCKNVTVKKGKTVTLKPKLTPSYSDDPITFKSNDKKIATVSSKGVVKGKKKGSTTIVVKSGKKSVKVKVTVK